MTISHNSKGGFRSLPGFWQAAFPLKAFAMAAVLVTLVMTGATGYARAEVLSGSVESNATGLSGYRVLLYAAFPGRRGWLRLGDATTNGAGNFHITYEVPGQGLRLPAILFVEAVRGRSMLASAIGYGGYAPANVVVNERTTVATGASFAQFIHGSRIGGNTYGTINAVRMAANLANPRTGNVGIVLLRSPNGALTTTLRTFNSLANAVASCVASNANCSKLFEAATPPGGTPPTNVLQAISNITKNPSYVAPNGDQAAIDPLFELSKVRQIYRPLLNERPTNWLLFLKFTGGYYSDQNRNNLLNGPGNIAIDERGYAWLNDNYVPQYPNLYTCAGRRLIKFYPWGQPVPGTPYFGGGLSGAGYGITLDPDGYVWIGNFGFQDPPCDLLPQAATKNSVSKFRPDGTPVSPSAGYTRGGISWPQGTIADRQGNIWVGNCGNDSVTKIPGGDPNLAFNIKLSKTPPKANRPQMKPFGIVLDYAGNLWVNDNRSDTISVISPAGVLIATLPGTYKGTKVLSHPMGNAADTKGNIWVANSDWVDVPCPTRFQFGSADNPSITLYNSRSRTPYPGSPYSGGGLTMPWGVAVDGNDTVWVFNFGAVPPGKTTDLPTGISRFCGTKPILCPAGTRRVGKAISPNTGYRSDALARITGGQIDRSGNIWMVANWKIGANPFKNPGGNSFSIAIGAAAPIQTPLIGPPVPAWAGNY